MKRSLAAIPAALALACGPQAVADEALAYRGGVVLDNGVATVGDVPVSAANPLPVVTSNLNDAAPIGPTPGAGNLVSASGATVSAGDVSFTANSQSVVIDTQGHGSLSVTTSGGATANWQVLWSNKPSGPFDTGVSIGSSSAGTGADGVGPFGGGSGQLVFNGAGRYAKIVTTGFTSGTLVLTPVLHSTRMAARSIAVSNAVAVNGNIASGSADSGNPEKIGGRYDATLPTYADGQRTNVQTGTRGSINVTIMDQNGTNGAFVGTGNGLFIQGQTPSGSPDGGNPVKVGCVYNSTLPTFSSGQRGECQIGARGQLAVGIWDPTSNQSTAVAAAADGMSNGVAGLEVIDKLTLFNGSTWDRWLTGSALGSSGNSAGVAAVLAAPTGSQGQAMAPIVTGAAASSLVIKSAPANLFSISITTAGSAGYLMVFDATSAPADGGVAPKMCRAVAANATIEVAVSDFARRFSTGVTAVFSTTGCFTKTASATAFIEALAL